MPEEITDKEKEIQIEEEAKQRADILTKLYQPQGDDIVSRSPHFKEIIDLMLRNHSPRKIEKHLLDHYGEADRISFNSLWSYRRKYIPDSAIFESNYLRKKFERRLKDLNELNELQNVIMMQAARISKMHEEEDRTGEWQTTIYRELATLKDLVKTSIELKMDMGLLQKSPTKHKHEHELFSAKLPEGLTVEGLSKVLSLAMNMSGGIQQSQKEPLH